MLCSLTCALKPFVVQVKIGSPALQLCLVNAQWQKYSLGSFARPLWCQGPRGRWAREDNCLPGLGIVPLGLKRSAIVVDCRGDIE